MAGDGDPAFRDDLTAKKIEQALAMSEHERDALRRRAGTREQHYSDAVATAYENLFQSIMK